VRAVVVAGCDLSGELDGRSLTPTDILVAVDGGANALARMGLMPSLLVGDLDSIDIDTRASLEQEGVEIHLLPRAKDETDTEAALRMMVDRGVDEIVVYGALGGPRLDHLVGNLLLLTAPWLSAVDVCMVDGLHEVFLAKGDAGICGKAGDTVSLLPLTPVVEAVRTEGLVYPLVGERLIQNSTRGVSNEMSGATARVTHEAGTLLVVHYIGR